MTASSVRDALLAVRVPDELEAQRRTWSVVRGAYAEREPAPRQGRRLRLLVAFAVLAALVAAALSPPGRSVGGWIRDRVAGEEATEPALVRLPSAGRLLVVSAQGPWLVRPDGSKRPLGNYEGASFSPNALFLVATQERQVVALEPDGDVRWTVTRPTPVADARWAPTPGFRVAYREGATLRVVGGDGKGDRLRADNIAPVPPAWRPGEGRTVLAYASSDGRVHVVEDDGEELWAVDPRAAPEQLVWSDDAGLLLVVTAGRRHPLYTRRRQAGRARPRDAGGPGRPRRGVRSGNAGHRLLGLRRGERPELDRSRRRAASAGRRSLRGRRLLAERALASHRLARGRSVALHSAFPASERPRRPCPESGTSSTRAASARRRSRAWPSGAAASD